MALAPRRAGRTCRILFALVLAVGVAFPVQSLDRLYGPGDPEVEEVSRLYRVAGKPFPTVAFPVSKSWLRDAALELSGSLPRAHSERLDRYIDGLGYSREEIRTAVELSFRPQAYLETDYLRESITEKLRREAPALSVAVSGALDDGPLLYTRVEAIREYRLNRPSNITPPLSGNPLPYEFNNLYEGYLYWPLEFFTITFGRQKLDLGPAPRSSIALAPELPYLDALRLTLDLGPVRMHHTIASIDNTEARQDVELPTPENDFYAFDRNQIFFNTHYFEYRFETWRLGVGANLVVSREMNNFALSDFFPVFSWHNANILPRNMSAFVDATVPLGPGVEIYGQASFDDIRTTGVGIGDQPIPTIPAFTLGSRYSRIDATVVWDFALDLGYTHYLWGNFPRETGLSRGIYRLRAEGDSYAFPLTSPYGPGTVYGLGEATVTGPRYVLSLLYEVVGRKPDADLFTTEQEESDLLASQAYRPSYRIEIEGSYDLTDWLSLMLRPGLYASGSSVDLYLDLGGSISYSASRVVAHRP
jgi:hypothetical protein